MNVPNAQVTGATATPQGGPVWRLPCPCGGLVRAEHGLTRPWVLVCTRCGGGMPMIDRLSLAYNVRPTDVLDGPIASSSLPWERVAPRWTGPPAPGLTDAQRRHSKQALWNRPDVMRWLREERGFKLGVIRRYGLGYGQPHPNRPPGLIIPSVAQVPGSYRIRYWPDLWEPPGGGKPVKISTPRGHSLRLYPELPDGGPVVLCEGELDAIITRQAGLAAVSTPGMMISGANAQALGAAADYVAVCFDVGAEAAAQRAAELVRAGGAEAWPVPLGLPNRGDDLNDFFTVYEGTAKQLRRLIREARHA